MSELVRAELARSVIAAVPRLSDDDLKRLADYVTTLAPLPPEPEPGVHPLFGSLAHLGGPALTLADFQQARKEMWANFPRPFSGSEGDQS